MMGLLSCIRAAGVNPNLVTLSMGIDLNELGLDLTTRGYIHTTFGGPYSDQSGRYVYHF